MLAILYTLGVVAVLAAGLVPPGALVVWAVKNG